MRVRIRGPNGQSTISLPAIATISDLETEISQTTSLRSFDIKYGFPPKPLSFELYPSKNTPLLNLEINLDGEILTISEREDTSASSTAAASEPKVKPKPKLDAPPAAAAPLTLSRKENPDDPPQVAVPEYASTMVLRVMPDDNSCLFRAFSSAFLGSELDSMHELRSVVAQAVQADGGRTYNAVVLEREPDDYCRWIQRDDAWGGGIELGILAQHFGVEIVTIDVQTCAVARFNEAGSGGQRVILVYSGIHYDVIALSASEYPHDVADLPPEHDRKIFEVGGKDDASDGGGGSSSIILERAVALCRILRSRHYYTDTHGFLVRCARCGYMCTGEAEVSQHAAATGHTDFGEA